MIVITHTANKTDVLRSIDVKYEVIDNKNKTMFCAYEPQCIHTQEEINSMTNAGYKIKMNNKIVPKSKIINTIKECLKNE